MAEQIEKLSESVIAELVQKYLDGRSRASLAREYGVGDTTISRYFLKRQVASRQNSRWIPEGGSRGDGGVRPYCILKYEKSGRMGDLAQKRFGRLVGVRIMGSDHRGHAVWTFRCDCGNNITSRAMNVVNGGTRSCGCLKQRGLRQIPPGTRFHRLVSVGMVYRDKGESFLRCECDCGNHKSVRTEHLIAGRVRSCGCLQKDAVKKRAIALVGVTIGRLTVIEPVVVSGQERFRCLCACGNERVIGRAALLGGNTLSCGCRRLEAVRESAARRSVGYEDLAGAYWNSLRAGAQSRSLEFSCDIREAWDLFVSQNRLCALTGVPISLRKPRTASCDRIDPSRGYTSDNIQWVHKRINLMKWDSAQEDFITLCHLVAIKHPRASATMDALR